MTAADRGQFAGLMAATAEVYGEQLSDARLELYFSALDDLSLEQLRAALSVHVRTQKFFPRPAEIREAVTGSVDDAAEVAWSAVLRLVRSVGFYGQPSWPNEATRRAALELYGGWQRLCESLPADGVGLVTAAKQFKASYAAYARTDLRRDALPPSKDEARELLSNLRARLTEKAS